jgi:transcriptional regulator with XRE-family HTH domain
MANKIETNSASPLAGATLAAWRERMGYSQRDACKALGCSRGAWTRWENSQHDVPKYIGLACSALALGMTAMGVEYKGS